jgi:hypothetical protein
VASQETLAERSHRLHLSNDQIAYPRSSADGVVWPLLVASVYDLSGALYAKFMAETHRSVQIKRNTLTIRMIAVTGDDR